MNRLFKFYPSTSLYSPDDSLCFIMKRNQVFPVIMFLNSSCMKLQEMYETE
jgi:hypothetical protein